MGLAVALHDGMLSGERVHGSHYALNDGLGERWVLMQPPHGQVEVLTLAPALASHAPAEPAIRARAERMADVIAQAVTAVRRVERDAAGMRVVADAVAGIRLSDVLSQLESGGNILPHAGMLELASAVVRALAVLHRLSTGLAHGAVTPAHIVLRPDGTAVLTDSVFGTALESLEWNREQLWREFHVALPAAASLPRFDQRADVTQLGAVVLAIALRRRLRDDEYPRGAADLVLAATADRSAHGASALRMWLQQALQLHSRSMFPSAVEAQRAFLEIAPAPGPGRAGARAVSALLQPPAC
ncbi:MAG TPA: hypothetical protein VIX63_06045 [Vicinamibacterales bacterium]